MKKMMVSVVLVLCLVGGWAVTALGLFGGEDTAARVMHYQSLAREQMELGGYVLARESYDNVIRLEDTADNRLEQVTAYRDAELTADFKKAAEALISAWPEDARGYEILAEYYDSVGAHGDCVKVVRRASAAGCMSDALRALYYDNAFVFVYLRGAYDSASPMKGGTGAVEADGQWGLVDSAGALIGGTVFRQTSNFIDSYAAVQDETHCGYLTPGGEWYLVLEEPFDRAYSMSGGGSVVFRNGKAEIVDRTGVVRLGPYEDATGFAQGVAGVREEGLWHLIDTSGEPVGEGGYQDIRLDSDGLCSTAGVVFVRAQDGWKLIDTKGKPCSDLTFDDVEPFFDGTYAAACVQGKWGFVDTGGAWAAEPQWEDAGSFGRGLAPVKQDGLWGYVDTTLRMVIEPQFQQAGPFAECGVAPVLGEDGWRYIKLVV